MTDKDFMQRINKGHMMYWDMLGELNGNKNNRQDGLQWLSGGIFYNYLTIPDKTNPDRQVHNIVQRMKAGELPPNLTFLPEHENVSDPRQPFLATGLFKESAGTAGMAHKLLDTPLPKPDKRLNIFLIHEESQIKPAGAILNTVFEYSLFSYEHFTEMMRTDNLFLYLAEYDGLPVGACMSQHGDDFVNISWVGTLPGYRKRGIGGYLVQAAEQEGRHLGKATGTLHAFDGAVNAYRRLGYKEYCRSVQLEYGGG